jgi:hypothetical protein
MRPLCATSSVNPHHYKLTAESVCQVRLLWPLLTPEGARQHLCPPIGSRAWGDGEAWTWRSVTLTQGTPGGAVLIGVAQFSTPLRWSLSTRPARCRPTGNYLWVARQKARCVVEKKHL